MKRQIKGGFIGNLPAPDDGLARYLRQAQSFPLLTASEEYEYASSWAKNHDKLSAEMLVSSHLRLVVSMAYELGGYGIPVGELIASGNVGLMQALQKFDPGKGFRFSTYATFWIRAEMYDMILSNWSLVKIGGSAAQKKVFFNLARTKRALGIMDSRLSGKQVKQIADKLEVSEADVEGMSERMHVRDVSLNAEKYDDGEGELVDFVQDDAKPIELELEDMEVRANGRDLLRRHLAELSGRDREILVARRLADPAKTLDELSIRHGISRERVRQIEERAFGKLKAAILRESDGNPEIEDKQDKAGAE
ncbi:MAG: RNA polymerase factor sigma-32 [Rickettsiales bacterium]|jgi:RNA polymerase sigma-32 factor|nr:RNA polymerase factor sigma-32 [Rickettsiales bacterium]